jgi:pimeloyl-ACP methyl ester carboxylesterase
VGERVRVGDVDMYYETAGSNGPPVLLIHGALGGAWAFAGQVEALSSRFRLFLPEQRGRSRTPDVPGPLSFAAMADDTLGFVDAVIGEPVHVVGVSDGGVIGLMCALRRPGDIRRLVVIGSEFHRDGRVPGTDYEEAPAEDGTWAMPRRRHAELSPDGASHWPVLFAKLRAMWSREPDLTVDDLETVAIPVLVMLGDDDAVTLEHAIAMYRALPQGRLAVIPGSSHGVFMEQPAVVNGLIERFLAATGPPQTLMPIRRRTEPPDGT